MSFQYLKKQDIPWSNQFWYKVQTALCLHYEMLHKRSNVGACEFPC